jgi:hypothetical protein
MIRRPNRVPAERRVSPASDGYRETLGRRTARIVRPRLESRSSHVGLTCRMMGAVPDSMPSLIGMCELTKVQVDTDPDACDVAGLTNRDRSATHRPCGNHFLCRGRARVTSAYVTGKHGPLCQAPVSIRSLHSSVRVASPARKLQHRV